MTNIGFSMENKITINGKTYIEESTISKTTLAKPSKGMKFCIIRTYSAGVFAGYIKKREGKEATIINSRRIWYWDGAASLSQLAMEGTNKPENCKFAMEVPETELTEVIEIISCTEKAKNNILNVSVWKK